MANETCSAPVPMRFKDTFCGCFGCPAEAFQETLLRKSLHPHLRPLAWLVRLMAPGFFREDLDYLGRVGETNAWQPFRTLANAIHHDRVLNHGLLRKSLHLRVSGSRLIKVYQAVAEWRREFLR